MALPLPLGEGRSEGIIQPIVPHPSLLPGGRKGFSNILPGLRSSGFIRSLSLPFKRLAGADHVQRQLSTLHLVNGFLLAALLGSVGVMADEFSGLSDPSTGGYAHRVSRRKDSRLTCRAPSPRHPIDHRRAPGPRHGPARRPRRFIQTRLIRTRLIRTRLIRTRAMWPRP